MQTFMYNFNQFIFITFKFDNSFSLDHIEYYLDYHIQNYLSFQDIFQV